MDISQVTAFMTQLEKKDDADCTPEELALKQTQYAITKEKKNKVSRNECVEKGVVLSNKLNEQTKAHAVVLENTDVLELNRLRTERKAVDTKIREFTKNSEDVQQFTDLEKEIKKTRADIAAINKRAKDNGLEPIVPTKRGGRKKDNGEALPMDTGDGESDSDSDSDEEGDEDEN